MEPAPILDRTPPTAIVSDLDGTLLGSSGTLSALSIEAVLGARAAGLTFVAATARTPRALRRIPGIEHLGTVVCANGAVVWDATADQIHQRTCFDPHAVAEAVARCRRVRPDLAWAYLHPDRMYADEAFLATKVITRHEVQAVTDVAELGGDAGLVALAVRAPDQPAVSFLDVVAAGFHGVGRASRACVPTVDVAPPGVSKATTVARLLVGLGHRPEQTVVFGDMPNDLPLFDWAGRSVAPANADPGVLDAADETLGHCDSDSVARRILELAGQALQANTSSGTSPTIGP